MCACVCFQLCALLATRVSDSRARVLCCSHENPVHKHKNSKHTHTHARGYLYSTQPCAQCSVRVVRCAAAGRASRRVACAMLSAQRRHTPRSHPSFRSRSRSSHRSLAPFARARTRSLSLSLSHESSASRRARHSIARASLHLSSIAIAIARSISRVCVVQVQYSTVHCIRTHARAHCTHSRFARASLAPTRFRLARTHRGKTENTENTRVR